jgi:CheY-like chemotaxis protein
MGEHTATGSSILLVDDEPPVLSMLRAVLESEGHAVTTATSAADARKKLLGHQYDVVVTDMRMETEAAGFEVVRAARLKPESPAIIILTAYPLAEEQWREVGADAGMMKGTPIQQFTAVVRQLLVARQPR